MANVADEAALDLYRSIIEEIMVRLYGVQSLMITPTMLRPTFVREYGYLQLRFCCELVALACLVCHGDIKAAHTKRIEKAYDPADILNQLEALHPDFYPIPVIQSQTELGFHHEPFDKEYLKKDQLIALWARAGNILHKGNLRKLLKNNVNHRTETKVDDLLHDMQLMINLVNTHRTMRLGGKSIFLIAMNIEGWESAIRMSITVTGAIAEAKPLSPSQ